MSGPVEILRAAAAKVRETAKAATPGPWERRQGNRVSSNIHAREEVVLDGGGTVLSSGKAVAYGAALNADADWIALMSPVLAGHLVGWLEGAAVELAGAIDHVAVYGGDPFDYCAEPGSVRRALALATALLGKDTR